MSLPRLDALPLDLIVFGITGAAALTSAVMVVKHRSLVYAAVFLALLGVSNAAFFAMLGYSFISLFHIAVYVGASVTFILFSITMFRKVPSVEAPAKALAVASGVLAVLALAYVFYTYLESPTSTVTVTYRELSRLFVERYRFPLIVASIALVTTMIEGITLARREVRA